MNGEMVWQNPPRKPHMPPNAGNKGKGPRFRFVEALRERPGVWALYPSSFAHRTTATEWKHAFPGVQTTTRSRPDGRYDLYVRWIGEFPASLVHDKEPPQ